MKPPWINRIVSQGSKPASQFLANPANWRQHPEFQRQAVRGSLNELGWIQNVIENVRTGHLVDGHERVWQAMDNGDAEVPFIQVDLSPEEELLALAILDPISALAQTDTAALDALLRQVETGEPGLEQMLAELAEQSGLSWGSPTEQPEAPEPQIDRAAELQVKWGTCLGQLWEIPSKTVPGRCHRLLCGDSTKAEDVQRLMGGERADACITDPPYNVDKADWDMGILPLLARAADLLPSTITNDGIVFWFCATRYLPDVIHATSAVPYRWLFIWYPSNNMAHGDLGFQKFTCALVLSKGKVWRKDMQDLRDVPIVISKQDPGHPTPKPVKLIGYIVEKACSALVYDGFLGSGTTMVAAEQLGRLCYGMDIEPKYVAVSLQRMADMGLEPRLTDGGATPTVGLQSETIKVK